MSLARRAQIQCRGCVDGVEAGRQTEITRGPQPAHQRRDISLSCLLPADLKTPQQPVPSQEISGPAGLYAVALSGPGRLACVHADSAIQEEPRWLTPTTYAASH